MRVPHAQLVGSVGIDDVGRILLTYLPEKAFREQTMRRSARGRWGKPHQISTRPGSRPELAVGARGDAAATFVTGDYGKETLFTRRMSPDGRWSAPVRQPGVLASDPQAVDVDAHGRALIGWWSGRELLARWSRPDGRWLKTCVLARGTPQQRGFELNPQVVVNRRGDALVVWRAKARVGQLWARYKPAGQAWSTPIRVTPASSPPRASFSAGLGETGYAAVAWTTRNNRQVQARRLLLTP